MYTQSGKGPILIACLAWRTQLAKTILIYIPLIICRHAPEVTTPGKTLGQSHVGLLINITSRDTLCGYWVIGGYQCLKYPQSLVVNVIFAFWKMLVLVGYLHTGKLYPI